jgi:transcriptional regulator with XRE-family HTH domain
LDSGKDDSDRYSVIQKETPDWEIWVTNQVSELIETGFRNPPLLTREQLSRLVRVGADLEGLSGFARILGVSSTAVDQWRLGAKQPLLPVYLRLARVFHVTLTDLLTGKVSPGRNQVLDLEGVPYWRNLYVRRSPHFDKVEAARRIDQALRELPPPSMRAFEKRNGYHYATLHKYFPDQCIAIQERFRESRAALTKQRRAQTAAEFRQIAYQLHEKGTDLCVNAVLKRMSPPRSLDYRIAREVLDEVKQEILANGKPLGNDLRPSRHPPTTIPSVVRAAPGCPEEV